LHPHLGEIIHILSSAGLRYGLSTNCGKTIEYQTEWFKTCNYIKISMCGFSQQSYDRIHKLDFEKVKSNIVSLVEAAKKANYNTKQISIAQHIYQFNAHEILKMRDFTNELGTSFQPYYAFINDPEVYDRFINNTLAPSEWNEISQDLYYQFM
jgi:hypothetical protein